MKVESTLCRSGGLETATCPLRPLQGSLLLTILLLIGVSDSLVTMGLPDHVLDTTDLVSEKHFLG